MAIDPRIEEPIPLKNRGKLGISRCKDTLRNWIEDGFFVRKLKRRVYLESIYVGNTLCTSKEALYRFLMRINGRRMRQRLRRDVPIRGSLPTSTEDSPMKKGSAKPADKKAPAGKQSAKKAPGKKTKKPC